jgi:hypothetical protein
MKKQLIRQIILEHIDDIGNNLRVSWSKSRLFGESNGDIIYDLTIAFDLFITDELQHDITCKNFSAWKFDDLDIKNKHFTFITDLMPMNPYFAYVRVWNWNNIRCHVGIKLSKSEIMRWNRERLLMGLLD